LFSDRPLYDVVIPARDEEKYLPYTLRCIRRQTVRPNQVIVVDDCSSDSTAKIALHFGCTVISTGLKEKKNRTSPGLARVFTIGLRATDPRAEFILMCGADHLLPPRYVEYLLSYMRANPLLGMISGAIWNEPFSKGSVRGSGRLIRSRIWRNVIGSITYPYIHGSESYLQIRMREEKYRVRAVSCVMTSVQRKTEPKSFKDNINIGRAHRALNYSLYYTFFQLMTMVMKRQLKPFIAVLIGRFDFRVAMSNLKPIKGPKMTLPRFFKGLWRMLVGHI
jgi:glycosyltransferase involved in cell wall biosynthesis